MFKVRNQIFWVVNSPSSIGRRVDAAHRAKMNRNMVLKNPTFVPFCANLALLRFESKSDIPGSDAARKGQISQIWPSCLLLLYWYMFVIHLLFVIYLMTSVCLFCKYTLLVTGGNVRSCQWYTNYCLYTYGIILYQWYTKYEAVSTKQWYKHHTIIWHKQIWNQLISHWTL